MYLGIQNEHTPRHVADSAECVDGVRAHFAGDVIDVVAADPWSVHCPVTKVANTTPQTVRRSILQLSLTGI